MQLNDSHREVQSLKQDLGSATRDCEDLAKESCSKDKLVYSVDDPCRPRFTLQELKEILQERNSLKAKVSDLEDELAVFKPQRNRDFQG